MYKLVLTCCCFLLLIDCFGQFEQHDMVRNQLSGGNLQWPDDSEYYEGSPYLYDEFVDGKIYTSDTVIADLPLRLNLHNVQVEFMWNDSVYQFLAVRNIDRIVLDEEVFIYLNSFMDTDGARFAKIWNNQFPLLLTTMNARFHPEEIGIPYIEAKPPRLEREDEHFVVTSQRERFKVTTIKKLIAQFDNHAEELSAFAKKEKISASNPDDLIKLLDYYRTLNGAP